MNELKVPEVASGSRAGYATSFSLSKSRDKLQEALIKHLRSKRKPRSGERSVAHGVSRGIRPNVSDAAPEGRNSLIINLRFRRSAADSQIFTLTHGSRRGLQIFRRSAAAGQALACRNLATN